MPREAMSDFGVPVDKGIAEYLNEINELPKIETTYSCSGLRKDHKGRPNLPYLVIATNRYVGTDLEPSKSYPHETHSTSLKVFRAAIQAGWYAKFTTTNSNGIDGLSAVYVSPRPTVTDYCKILCGNVTGNPVKTRYNRRIAKEKIQEEREKFFISDPTDSQIKELWEALVDELTWELKERNKM